MLHQDRLRAHQELHARPFPVMAFDAHLALMCVKASTQTSADVWQWLSEKVIELPKQIEAWQSSGDFWIRVEPHTEFISIVWLSDHANPWDDEWMSRAPTAILVLSEMVPSAREQVMARSVVSHLAEGDLLIGGDLLPGADGVTRWSYAFADAPDAIQRGKSLQMVMEVETYRVLALIRMDQIRAVHPQLQQISSSAGSVSLEGESRQMLEELEYAEARLDAIWQQINWRVGACRAYYDLVFQRLNDLHEGPVEQCIPLGRFLGRRMTPAIKTAETILRRQQELSNQVSHKANLLRTRMQLDLQEQHAHQVIRQTRLQSTVEGLSVVAISYYALGLISAAVVPLVPSAYAKGVKAALVPAVVLGVWWVLRQVKKKL